MNFDELVNKLISLGFSSIEAKVYCTLIPENGLSGYQIGKKLKIARSSIYPTLDCLCAKGFAELIPGESNLYKAAPPEKLFSTLAANFTKTAASAKEELIALAGKQTSDDRFINISGKSNLIKKAIDIINGAKSEIVMNTTMDLHPFNAALKLAGERGVRIILFSWLPLETEDLPVEFYNAWNGEDFCVDQRLLLVSDINICLAGSNDRGSYHPHKSVTASEKLPAGENDFIGVTSENKLIVSLILEHIHFDIYMLKLRQKNGGDIVTHEIQLGSLMEKGIR